ncbi:MAG: DEAD/DEAH box helicase [Thermoplasmatota archaeon]|jgi:ATP-dependent RNA helicase DeaD
MKFNELNINKILLDKINEKGFGDMTLIQEKCVPIILKGEDVIGQAETGSGKTLAYCLPILDKIIPGKKIQTLILTPTRELCVQITEVLSDFGKKLRIKTTGVYGGVDIDSQIKNIVKSEVIVGTPGRIIDHIHRKTINFDDIRFLVLDEMDKMFDMGFLDDVEYIINHVSKKRQTLMFSATVSKDIQKLLYKHLKNPVIIKTKPFVSKNKLKQVYYDIYQPNKKFSLLVHLIKNNKSGLAIVFCATRKESDIIAKNLRYQDIQASAIHGGMSQNKRLQALDSLKNGFIDVLVATDVAARGLDIKNVTHIYNYDVPKTSIEYIHRIGRTARAGENGSAITLLTKRDHDNFRRVQNNDDLNIEKADFPNFDSVPFMIKFKKNHY